MSKLESFVNSGRLRAEHRRLRSDFIEVVEELFDEIKSLNHRSIDLEVTNSDLKKSLRQLELVLDAKERFGGHDEFHEEKESLRDENVGLRNEVKRLERLLNHRKSSAVDEEKRSATLKSAFKSNDLRGSRQIQFSRQSVGMECRVLLPGSDERRSGSLVKRVSLDAPPSPEHKKASSSKIESGSLVINAVRTSNAVARRARSKQSLFSAQSSFVAEDNYFRFDPLDIVKDSEILSKLVSVMGKIEACQSHDLLAVARAMTASKVQQGDTVCIQGEPGLYFMVIGAGEFSAEAVGSTSSDLKGPDDYIGEAIFVHPFPMAPASVTCTSAGGALVWTIHTEVLRQVMREVAIKQTSIVLSDVKIGRTIGRGGTAVVKLASVPKEEETGTKYYALKIIKKRVLEKHHKLSMLQNERFILSQLDSPFVIKLRTSFKDSHHIYFLLELAPGGDLLTTVLNNLGVLTHSQTQFYAACIVSALEHVHQRGIIFRDLKAENLLIDERGYLKLTDFGVAKKLMSDHETTYSLVGTPQFMAPEIILGRGYTKSVDFWALGCCVFEFLTGELPFVEEKDQFELFKKIIHFKPDQLVFSSTLRCSGACEDFVRRLLEPSPILRLGGAKSIADLKTHAFFDPIDSEENSKLFSWEALIARKLKPPFEPLLRPLSSSTNSDALSDDMTAASPALSAVSWSSFKDQPDIYI